MVITWTRNGAEIPIRKQVFPHCDHGGLSSPPLPRCGAGPSSRQPCIGGGVGKAGGEGSAELFRGCIPSEMLFWETGCLLCSVLNSDNSFQSLKVE